MSDRTDRIKELAETYSEQFWAQVIAFPKPFTAVFTIALFFLAALGIKSLL